MATFKIDGATYTIRNCTAIFGMGIRVPALLVDCTTRNAVRQAVYLGDYDGGEMPATESDFNCMLNDYLGWFFEREIMETVEVC